MADAVVDTLNDGIVDDLIRKSAYRVQECGLRWWCVCSLGLQRVVATGAQMPRSYLCGQTEGIIEGPCPSQLRPSHSRAWSCRDPLLIMVVSQNAPRLSKWEHHQQRSRGWLRDSSTLEGTSRAQSKMDDSSGPGRLAACPEVSRKPATAGFPAETKRSS